MAKQVSCEVFPNPSLRKVPARMKYKAVCGAGPVIGIGYASTKVAAKKRAREDFRKQFPSYRRRK